MTVRLLFLLPLLLFLSLVTTVHGAEPLPEVTAQLDQLMEQNIARGLIAGAVVVVGTRTGTRLERAWGKTSTLPDAFPMRTDTIFDLASLTKVIATTPAVLKLAEEGRLSLVDPVTKWLPEFAGKGKEDLLVLHLLTHTSGLDDFALGETNPRQSAIMGAAAARLKGEIGSRFHYADINFILLAEIVTRATGETLDRYTGTSFFTRLGMNDTGFCPSPASVARCAATYSTETSWLLGLVQDYPARKMGGIAGHAGLFSTALDLGIFCRMLLNGGELDGKRVLSTRAVDQMTAPYFSRGGKVMRGLGWDMASPYSSPKGSGFSEVSFGHTGYTGSSVWVDPERDLFVVLLTTRLEYRNVSEMNHLRNDLSSLAARLFLPPRQPVAEALCAAADCPP